MGRPYGAGSELDPGHDEPGGTGAAAASARRRRRAIAGPIALAVAAVLAAVALLLVFRPVAGPELVLLKAVDYGAEPDGPVGADERWNAEVADGVLRIRAVQPGAVHLPLVEAAPTEAMSVAAALDWPSGAAGDELFLGGILVFGPRGDGWGVACGTDGDAYVLAIWPDRSQALDVVPDAGCGDGAFELSLRVDGGASTDTITVALPDGRDVTFKPGEARGPFVEAGFVLASGDRTLVVPGLDVEGYQVRVEG